MALGNSKNYFHWLAKAAVTTSILLLTACATADHSLPATVQEAASVKGIANCGDVSLKQHGLHLTYQCMPLMNAVVVTNRIEANCMVSFSVSTQGETVGIVADCNVARDQEKGGLPALTKDEARIAQAMYQSMARQVVENLKFDALTQAEIEALPDLRFPIKYIVDSTKCDAVEPAVPAAAKVWDV